MVSKQRGIIFIMIHIKKQRTHLTCKSCARNWWSKIEREKTLTTTLHVIGDDHQHSKTFIAKHPKSKITPPRRAFPHRRRHRIQLRQRRLCSALDKLGRGHQSQTTNLHRQCISEYTLHWDRTRPEWRSLCSTQRDISCYCSRNASWRYVSKLVYINSCF